MLRAFAQITVICSSLRYWSLGRKSLMRIPGLAIEGPYQGRFPQLGLRRTARTTAAAEGMALPRTAEHLVEGLLDRLRAGTQVQDVAGAA